MVQWFLNLLKSGKVESKEQFTQQIKYNSTETILVKVFFEILKTGNTQLLNPLKVKISQSELDLIWENILKDYYSNTNKKRYKQLISKEKSKWLIRNKITSCSACLLLINIPNSLEREEALKTLEYFGYKGFSNERIESSLLKDKSKLEYLISQDSKVNQNEEINFWRILSQVENALGRQLDIEKITLAYWIELIKGIKERNLENGKQRRNTKVRHNF